MQIKKISCVVPEEKKSIFDFPFEKSFLHRFENQTGISFVRQSKLEAHEMAIRAIKNLKIDYKDIETIIYVTQTPLLQIPSTAHLFHKLGFSENCKVIEVNQSCSGYVYGLFLADSILRFKRNRDVLLVTSDKLRNFISEDNTNSLLFSDAATATHLSFNMEFSYYDFLTDSSGVDDLKCQNGVLDMKGENVFKYVIEKIPAFIGEYSFKKPVFTHQPNLQMIKMLESRLGRPLPQNITKYGNTSSSSIPLLLADKEANFKNIILCGFGAGFSAAKAEYLDFFPDYVLNEI